jgi:hypothetical protein
MMAPGRELLARPAAQDLRLARDEARSHDLHTGLLDTALSALDACTRHGAAGVQMLAAG